MSQQRIVMIIILVLAGIGLLASFRQLLIPIGVFGIIFLLWKFPPDRWMRGGRQGRGGRRTPDYKSEQRRRGATTKEGKFRVIQGNKDKDDPEDKPRYH